MIESLLQKLSDNADYIEWFTFRFGVIMWLAYLTTADNLVMTAADYSDMSIRTTGLLILGYVSMMVWCMAWAASGGASDA